jgi:hypothetical protein
VREGLSVAERLERLRERLELPEAVLSRTDLRLLGHERRAIDAILRACPVVAIPGYSRPLIRVADYRALIERSTYRDDRVRSCGSPTRV